jgi:hypothetical protein
MHELEIDRREFLKAGFLTAAAFLLKEHHEKPAQFLPTFEDPKAEKIAEDLSITPGDYFIVNSNTMTSMNDGMFIHSDKILPIIAPGVRAYDEDFIKTAKETELPINFLAVIATIESSGQSGVESGADAIGLLQVVPEYHMAGFIAHDYLPKDASYEDYQAAMRGKKSKVSYERYQKVFTNPGASLVVGADYLKSCLESARQSQAELDPNSPIIYAWAAAAYNGGESLLAGTYNEMPQQAQLYVNHVIRMLIDVDVAARLRYQGMEDNEIVKAMWSNEMNARAYAYGELGNVVSDYNDRAELLTYVVPGIPNSKNKPESYAGSVANESYKKYLAGKGDVPSPTHKDTIPAPPGLRIWLEGGGSALFDDVSTNAKWRIK